jgi:hypothetical protein
MNIFENKHKNMFVISMHDVSKFPRIKIFFVVFVFGMCGLTPEHASVLVPVFGHFLLLSSAPPVIWSTALRQARVLPPTFSV